MRRSERQGEWVAWAAMGLGVGVLAGFVLAESVGKMDRARIRRAVDGLAGRDSPALLTSDRAARLAERALDRTPGLTTLALEARGLRPGVVELAGWVPDRHHRALAERTVAAVEGIDSVVNRLLVEAEDPNSPVAELQLEDQTA